MKIKNLRLLPKTTSCMTVDGGPMRGVAAMTAKCSGAAMTMKRTAMTMMRYRDRKKLGTGLCNTEKNNKGNEKQVVILFFFSLKLIKYITSDLQFYYIKR